MWKGSEPRQISTLLKYLPNLSTNSSDIAASWPSGENPTSWQHRGYKQHDLHGGNKLRDRFGMWTITMTHYDTMNYRYPWMSMISISWLQSDTFCTLGHVPRRAPFPPEALVARRGFHLAGVRARHEMPSAEVLKRATRQQQGSKVLKAEAVQNQKHAFFAS